MKSQVKELPRARVKGCCEPIPLPLDSARAKEVARILKAVADPTRIQIIHALKSAEGPICICDLTGAFDLGQPTISHHMSKLREAGVVDSFKQGIWSFYSLSPKMSDVVRNAIALID